MKKISQAYLDKRHLPKMALHNVGNSEDIVINQNK